jgi:hypothetical protein
MFNNPPPQDPNKPSSNPFDAGNNPSLSPFGEQREFTPGYQAQYMPPPSKKSFFTPLRLLLGCGALVLVCVVIGGAIFAFVSSEIQPAKDKSEEFMEALKSEDYEAAYAMGDPEFQEVVGSAEALREGAQANNAIPEKWSFDTGGSINSDSDGTTASFTGSVTYQDGSEHDLEMELTKIDDEWYINYFSFE